MYLRISSYIRKPFLMQYMTLRPIPSEFPYEENWAFFFISVSFPLSLRALLEIYYRVALFSILQLLPSHPVNMMTVDYCNGPNSSIRQVYVPFQGFSPLLLEM